MKKSFLFVFWLLSISCGVAGELSQDGAKISKALPQSLIFSSFSSFEDQISHLSRHFFAKVGSLQDGLYGTARSQAFGSLTVRPYKAFISGAKSVKFEIFSSSLNKSVFVNFKALTGLQFLSLALNESHWSRVTNFHLDLRQYEFLKGISILNKHPEELFLKIPLEVQKLELSNCNLLPTFRHFKELKKLTEIFFKFVIFYDKKNQLYGWRLNTPDPNHGRPSLAIFNGFDFRECEKLEDITVSGYELSTAYCHERCGETKQSQRFSATSKKFPKFPEKISTLNLLNSGFISYVKVLSSSQKEPLYPLYLEGEPLDLRKYRLLKEVKLSFWKCRPGAGADKSYYRISLLQCQEFLPEGLIRLHIEGSFEVAEFRGMEKLEVLYFRGDPQNPIQRLTFGNLVLLERMNVENSNLIEIPDLRYLENVKKVNEIFLKEIVRKTNNKSGLENLYTKLESFSKEVFQNGLALAFSRLVEEQAFFKDYGIQEPSQEEQMTILSSDKINEN